jgi:CubicO group peptidase (beta-lactamase class C family)
VDGHEHCACHDVTSVENPLPVDRDTLFPPGLGDEDLTATTVMRLVADGRVDLDKPVRRYVAELRLKDELSAAETTLLNLVNHA